MSNDKGKMHESMAICTYLYVEENWRKLAFLRVEFLIGKYNSAGCFAAKRHFTKGTSCGYFLAKCYKNRNQVNIWAQSLDKMDIDPKHS